MAYKWGMILTTYVRPGMILPEGFQLEEVSGIQWSSPQKDLLVKIHPVH